jgi:hypothetical protein
MSAALLRLLDEGRRESHFGSAALFFLGFLLPLECAYPVFIFVLIKFGFPPAYWLFAGGSCMVFGVASDAITMLDVVEKLPLKFAGDQLAVNCGSKIGTFKTGRQGCR